MHVSENKRPNALDFVAVDNGEKSVVSTASSCAQPCSSETVKQSSVSQFCEQFGIAKEFEIARRLASECFGEPELKFSVETDSESGDKWISIDVPSKGKTASETFAMYGDFVNNLVRAIPSDKRRFFCASVDFQS